MPQTLKFNYLSRQYKDKIFSYACYMLRSKMDAEDVTQEVLIRLWQNIGKFKMSAAKAWIMRTTHNLCIDYLRKNKIINQRTSSINEDILNIKTEDEKTTNPDVHTQLTLLKQRLRKAIENLPEKLKGPFIMYELQGFKYREISKALDMPINSVKVYLLRARKKLQEELKEYENERLA